MSSTFSALITYHFNFMLYEYLLEYFYVLCTVVKLAPLDIANCNVFFEPKLSAGRPLRAARLTSTSTLRSTVVRRGRRAQTLDRGCGKRVSESSLLIWIWRGRGRTVKVYSSGGWSVDEKKREEPLRFCCAAGCPPRLPHL